MHYESRDVFCVFPKFGPGGMTTAIMNRTAQLAEAGHRCKIVAYDYDAEMRTTAARHQASGRLHDGVEVVSPYYSLKDANTLDPLTAADPTVHALTEDGFLIQDDEYTTRNYARYFTSDGIYKKNKNWNPNTGKLTHIDHFNEDKEISRREEFDVAGMLHREIGYVRGKKNRERYFTVDGFCYLVRWYEPEDNKPLSVYTFERSSTKVTRYSSVWAWRLDWLRRLVNSCQQKVLVLGDGTYVPPQLLNLKSDNASNFVVLHTNHRDADGELRPRYEPYFSKLDKFDGLVALTHRQAKDIAYEFGLTKRVWTIPNAINLWPLRNLEKNDHQAVILARITAGKGIDDSIQAFRSVVDRIPDATLNIFGEGLPADKGKIVNKLKALITELGLENNVFLRGYTNEALAEFEGSALSILSSYSEGLPYTVAESMTMQTPVVAYDCKYGPADFITDGEDGYLVEEGNVELLAQRITSLMLEPDLAKNMGIRARNKISTEHSSASSARRWQELISTMIG